jgi:hypothetical protein
MDKRRAPRRSHDSVLEIYDQEGNFVTGIGRLVDFSTVGACFSTTKPLKKGDKLQVRIRLIKEGPLEAAATVVWTRKQRNTILYGIAFDSLKKLQR